jgi:hypothetical protein
MVSAVINVAHRLNIANKRGVIVIILRQISVFNSAILLPHQFPLATLFDVICLFLQFLRMRCHIPKITAIEGPTFFIVNKPMVIILLVSAGNAHINGELCIVSACELDPLGCKR